MSNPSESPLLSEVLPPLVPELEKLLMELGELELVAQIPEMRVVDRCRCGDDFCSSFYVGPKPKGSYGPNHRTMPLSPKQGMLILDIDDGKIVFVEALYRNDVRKAIDAIVTLATGTEGVAS
jgi:hypothetical protein